MIFQDRPVDDEKLTLLAYDTLLSAEVGPTDIKIETEMISVPE